MNFIEEIYRITAGFPKKEQNGFVSQLRRSLISITVNIAEGNGVDSYSEFNRFLAISLRSSYEAMCGIEVATRLNYCQDKDIEYLLGKCNEVSAMIAGFKKQLRSRLRNHSEIYPSPRSTEHGALKTDNFKGGSS